MDASPYRNLLGLLCLISAIYAFQRDFRALDHQYGMDLRNRIVGARLERDGKSPYFYRWQPADGVEYYDPMNNDPNFRTNGMLSVNTATPFFHHLLWPLTGFRQHTIARIWLILEYFMWAGILLCIYPLARSRLQKAMVLVAGVLFLFTMPWKIHIQVGQYYLIIPFLAAVCFRLLQYPASVAAGFICGLLAITLVLIRPNAGVFFIPFLWLARNYNTKFKIALVIPVVLLLGWTILSPAESGLWRDFEKAIGEHVREHLKVNPYLPGEVYKPYAVWEGVHQSEVWGNEIFPPGSNEWGNFFLLWKSVFHRTPGALALGLSAAGCIILLLIFFWFRQRKKGAPPLAQLAILGYCLYMITDLFSPIIRWQYYAIQWLFPVLLALATYGIGEDVENRGIFQNPVFRRMAYLLLLAGVGLNLLNLPFFDKEHTVGEYCMLISLLVVCITTFPIPGSSKKRPEQPIYG